MQEQGKLIWYAAAIAAAVLLDFAILRSRRMSKTDSERPDTSHDGPQSGEGIIGAYVLMVLSGLVLFIVHLDLQGQNPARPITKLLITLAAIVPMALAVWLLESQQDLSGAARLYRRFSAWSRVHPNLVWVYPLAPVLAFLAWRSAGEDSLMRLPVLAITLWLAAMLIVVLPAWANGIRLPKTLTEHRREVALVVGLFLVALILRAAQLETIPWLFTGDEAAAGLFSSEITSGNTNNPFITGWFSFPSLYFFLPASSIAAFGRSVAALRLPAAVGGALAVVAVYMYARSAFGRRTAIFASVFLTVFHFHIHFSRLGLNNVWDSLFYPLVAFALWRAWRNGAPADYAWAGLALGVSQYFYVSSKALPAILLLWILIALAQDRHSARKRLPGLVVTTSAFLAAALPLLMYYARHPEQFTAPLFRVSRLREGIVGAGEWGSIATTFITHIQEASLAFTSTDLTQFYNPGGPMLLPLSATLFLVGVVLMLFRFRQLQYTWLSLWLLSSLVASALSEGVPAAQRYAHVAPAVAVLVGLPLDASFRWSRRLWRDKEHRIVIVTSLLMLIMAYQSLSFYFFDYSRSRRFSDLNTEAANLMADYLKDFPVGTEVWFLASYMSFRSHGTEFLAPHIIGHDLPEPLGTAIEIDPSVPTVFIAPTDRFQELEILHDLYPSGATTQLDSAQGNTLLLVYEIPPQ